jgi:hypothetical protein
VIPTRKKSPTRGEPTGTPTSRMPSMLGGRPDPDAGERRSVGQVIARWVRGAFVDNAPLKFVALVLSLTVFILVQSDERAIAGRTVRVQYIPPEGRVLVSEPIREVSITVEGSRRRLKRFHEAQLEEIEIDLRTMATGGDVYFQSNMIKGLPEGIELVSITPPSVKVELDKRDVKEVPVVVETSGVPARGFTVKSVTASPPRVQVAGAAARLALVETAPTAPVRLDGKDASFKAEARFNLAPGLEAQGIRAIQVEVVLDEQQSSREIDVQVEVKAGQGVTPDQTARFVADPDRVQVVLRGSTLAIEQVRPHELSAYVTLYPDDVARAPTRRAEVHITPARAGIGYEISPPEVTLRLKQ